MSMETETILERRRLRRKLGFWRSFAILAAVLALGAFALLSGGGKPFIKSDQIARVSIEGMITEDRKQIEMLNRIAKADHVKGVILFVNSPGGTTTGGEALFNGLRKIAERKPLVAQFGTVAASAAYIAGLGSDHIVARGNTITGSVGVVMQWPELSAMLEKLGIKMNVIKSGKLKAEPSPFKPVDEENRELLGEMIAEGQRWFLGLVKDRRKIDTGAIPGLEQGRVYSGREALRHKLIDQIGGHDEAVAYLVKKRDLPEGLKVVDWKPKADLDWPLSRAVAAWLSNTFASLFGITLPAISPSGTVGLDGLVSIWQPGKN